jgi:hypothetical protein
MTAALTDVFAAVKERQGQPRVRRLGVVRRRDLERFSIAVGGDGAELLFLSSVLGWEPGPTTEELRPDGAAPAALVGLDLKGLRIMGAGQDLEFFGEVGAEQDVTEEVTVEDAELKSGGSGDFLIIRLRRVFRSGDEVLVDCLETLIGR